MSEALRELAAHLELRQPDAVVATHIAFGELTVEVALAHLVSFVDFLKSDWSCHFTTLVDITAVDHPERAQRFDVVYHFLSMWRNHRIRVKARVGTEDMVPSLIAVHPAANWFERGCSTCSASCFPATPTCAAS
jgi:NADH-quinone oxidoreductase subunit C